MKQDIVSLGKSIVRTDAQAKVTGQAAYPGDIDKEGQLWLKQKMSDRAHAQVVHVDTSKALALPGVVAVFTSEDVPVNEYGLIHKDQPVICGKSAKAGTEFVRCYMDCVAVVVAETDAIAAQSLKLIDVEYEDLPTVFDAISAMQDGAPQLHEHAPNNIFSHVKVRRGDIQQGWQQAEVVIEETYTTTWQEHAFLQPEAGLSYIDDEGRVTVVVAGQWTHEDQEQIYHALNLDPEQVRVIYPAIGGAFGGREDMSVQVVLALATWKLRRPIKAQWTREESMLYHHKRHPITVQMKWGATKQGKVVAIEGTLMGDGGGYHYTSRAVMNNAVLTACGAYQVPNVHLDGYAVYTNNIPTGAFRGFGAPQALFAAEGQMDRLADLIGMDRLEIRRRNAFTEGSFLHTNSILPAGVTMDKVLDETAKVSGWTLNADNTVSRSRTPQPTDSTKRRGIGVACGFKNVGYSFGFPESSWAKIELHGSTDIERVVVYAAGADVGQGAHTAFIQMAAQAVGVDVSKVELVASDTATSNSSGSASASRLTLMSGNAIKGAGELALEHWAAEERPAVAEYKYIPPKTSPYNPHTGESVPNFSYAYTAQVIEVEVDIETGIVDILNVYSVHDVGKTVNPVMLIGQIEGGVVQAQGYALMENLVSTEGKIKNPYLSTYLIPTVLDVPKEVHSVILEYPNPIGPWGVRGVAEMPMLPFTPAIAAAIHDATGVWLTSQPFTPEKVVKALRSAGLGVI
jgi:CO/xanthine dehydrogenase Mo-binding subunit